MLLLKITYREMKHFQFIATETKNQQLLKGFTPLTSMMYSTLDSPELFHQERIIMINIGYGYHLGRVLEMVDPETGKTFFVIKTVTSKNPIDKITQENLADYAINQRINVPGSTNTNSTIQELHNDAIGFKSLLPTPEKFDHLIPGVHGLTLIQFLFSDKFIWVDRTDPLNPVYRYRAELFKQLGLIDDEAQAFLNDFYSSRTFMLLSDGVTRAELIYYLNTLDIVGNIFFIEKPLSFEHVKFGDFGPGGL